MNQPETQPGWAWVARIRRPQGRKGEVFADILTDFPEKFADRRQLWLIADPDSPVPARKPAPTKGPGLGGTFQARRNQGVAGTTPLASPAVLPRKADLRDHWLHKGGIVLHFSESNSISDAETLTGIVVAVSSDQRAALSPDEFYIGDLIGCAVFDETGSAAGSAPNLVGVIEEVDRSAGPVALLVVRRTGTGAEVLIPFAKSYLRAVEIAAKRVVMALPEGLLDLNGSQPG